MEQFLDWLTSSKTREEDYKEYLNFVPQVSQQDCQKLLNNGWWHVLPIATQSSSILALHILPKRPWTTWPVVRIFDYNRAINFAPHIGLLTAFTVFDSTYADANLRAIVLEEWGEEVSLAKELPSSFGGSQGLEKTYEWLKKIETSTDESIENDTKYRLFWEDMYPQESLFQMHADIEAMQKDMNYIPDANTSHDPIVQLRRPHLLGSRAYTCFYETNDDLFHHLWKSFTALPGYNAESTLFHHRPSESSDSDIQDFGIAEVLKVAFDNKNQDQQSRNPWYDVVLALATTGRKAYQGEAHLLAASQLIQNKANIQEIWSALIGASYWSGMNKGSIHWQTFEQALSIAKKNPNSDFHLSLMNHQPLRP